MKRRRLAEPAPLRIEAENEWAWCGDRRLELTPKAFAVLRHLVSHPGRLVTKTEILDAVWAETVVSEAALTSCIRDLRRALGDSSRSPRYLETVHRRGFRFIGPLGAPDRDAAGPPLAGAHRPTARAPVPRLVGRDEELARLHALFADAHEGRRRVVFVTGEAGIGKTTLVEAFLAQLEPGHGLRVGRGQCVEQYGAGEAYLPVLEALGRMGREPGGDALVETLRRYAPTWLAQLPALLADDELEAVQRRARGSTRERMLRELSEAFDAISREHPMVLVLEDLHWSDAATIDLLAMLARRRDAARLLIVATMRPSDVATAANPLRSVRQELLLHGDCEDLALPFLRESAVAEYVAARLPGALIPARLGQVLHRSTSGNPLFVVSLVDDLIARGHVREADAGWELAVPLEGVASEIPETLWQMVEKQIERLAPLEQAVLAVASVAGVELSAALATVDGIDAGEAEEVCASLARRGQMLRDLGVAEWPDGTVAGRYGFIHALYREVLYARVSIGRRVGLHLRIGTRLEQAHAARACDVAGELAMHFEAGRDFERALRYRKQAADNALRHHGQREAESHARRALEVLAAFPESPERLQEELAIRTTLGAALIPRGSAAPEVVSTYARARELASRVGVSPAVVPALVGLLRYYASRMELGITRELADQLLALAEATGNAAIRLGADNAAGMASFYAGDLSDALTRLERGLAAYDPLRHSASREPAYWGGHDVGVSCGVHAAWTLWLLGYPDRAGATMREAIDRARSAGYPFTLANACSFAAVFHACRRDAGATRELADEALVQSTEHGFELLVHLHAVHHGWLLCEAGELDEGVTRIRAGVTGYREEGARMGLPTFLGLLAEAEGERGRPAEGLSVVADALEITRATGARYWDAELVRLRGVLLLRAAELSAPRRAKGRRAGATEAEAEAEAAFLEAIETARRQGAKVLELRAATSLARLQQAQGRPGEARDVLAGIHGTFGEGFETADLAQARALLAQLGVAPGER